MFAQVLPAFRRTRLARSLLVVLTGGLTAVFLALGVTASQAAAPGPVHAGNTYGWYYHHNVFRQEFIGHLPKYWHRHGKGKVRTQHGMITLETHTGTLSATLTGHAHRTGRWEVRLRSKRYETAHANYKVATELVPARSAYHCGAQNVGLEKYRLGSHETRFYSRTLQNFNFNAGKAMSLHNDQWHTFAVEVTKKHISWFIDAHVVRTERRPEALSGIPLTLRFSLVATPGHTMNHSRMQADWMRYWSYNRPSTKSIKAPRMTKGTFTQAC